MSANFSPNFNGWIHELARAESSPEAALLDGLTKTSGPQQAIEESTVDFLTDLRADFEEYVRVFNSISEDGKKFSDIKLFNLAEGAANFMLYRNGIKLIVSNTAHGVIQFSYNRHATVQQTGADSMDIPSAEELLAQVGVFGSVQWTCRSEKTDSESVSRYFFAEFIRLTRERKKTKPNKQVLLDQIKALLNEQGLSLD